MATMTAVTTNEAAESTNEIDFDSEQLRGAIRFVLTAMKQGELPNLDASSYNILVSPAKGGAKKSRDKLVRKVLGHVVDHLLLEKTPEPTDEKAAKKRRKQLTKTLETTSLDMVNSLIHMESAKLKAEENEDDQPGESPDEEETPDSTDKSHPPEKSIKVEEVADQDSGDRDDASEEPDAPDMSTNTAKNEIGEVNNSGDMSEDDLALDPEKNLAYINAKAEFERERDEIMSNIPAEVRRCFRSLAFAKWGKETLPGIQLGPYDVSPGNVRDQWMNMFHNTRKSGRPMTRLIYWYGLDDLSESFSFLPATRITPYEVGVEKGWDKPNAKLQRRIDTGKELTRPERSLIHGLKQIKDEAELGAEERVNWIKKFGEDYEFILEDQAAQLEETPAPEAPPPEATEPQQQKPKKRASTTSKPRKRKKKDLEADAEEEGAKQEDPPSPPSKKQQAPKEETAKKKKKRKKKEVPEPETEATADQDSKGQEVDVAADPGTTAGQGTDAAPDAIESKDVNVPKKKKKKKGETQEALSTASEIQSAPPTTSTVSDASAEPKVNKPKKTLKRKREKKITAAASQSATAVTPLGGDVAMTEPNGDVEVTQREAPAEHLSPQAVPKEETPKQEDTTPLGPDISKDKTSEDDQTEQLHDGAIVESVPSIGALDPPDDDAAEEEVKSDSDKGDEDFEGDENDDDAKDDEDFEMETAGRAKRRRSSGGSRSSTSKAGKTVDDDTVAESEGDAAAADMAKKRKKKTEMTEEEKEEERKQKLAKRRASYQEKAEKKRAEKLAEMDEETAKAEKEAQALAKACREEQRKLEECERFFLPIMEKLRQAIEDKDAGSVPQSIADLNAKIGLITPAFVRGHSLGLLIKELRQTFEADNSEIGAQCRSLTSELKRVFKEKEKDVPSGFQPKYSRSTPKQKKTEEGEKPAKKKLERSPSLDAIPSRRESDTGMKPDSLEKSSVPAVAGKAVLQRQSSGSVSRDSTGPPMKKETATTQTPKTPRNFSLRRMFEKPEKPKEPESTTPRQRVPQSDRKATTKVQLPSWLSGSDTPKPLPDDPERAFAFHFLQDAMGLLPSDQVNAAAAAHALELVLYQFYKKALEGRASVLYWERVHGIAAAIVGRNGEGQLAKRLLRGEFANPRDVLKLDETALNRMFSS